MDGTMKEAVTARLIAAKAKIVDPTHHCMQVLGRDANNRSTNDVKEAVKLCSLGALMAVSSARCTWNFDTIGGVARDLLRRAAIDLSVADNPVEGDSISVICDFNNRGHEAAMTMYDKAIELSAA